MNEKAQTVTTVTFTSPADQGVLKQVKEAQTHFKDPPDTLLFHDGEIRGSMLARRIFPGKIISCLDVGAGVALATTGALALGHIDSAMSIEISPDASQRAEIIASTLGVHNTIITGDITDPAMLELAKAQKPTIVAGNLPYLPAPESGFDSTVDGGPDGTAFIETLLTYAQETDAPIATLNMCSMTTPAKVMELITQAGYAIHEVIVKEEGFGVYTTKLLDDGVIHKGDGQIYYKDPQTGDHKQLMMNLVLVKQDLATQHDLTTMSPANFLSTLLYFETHGKLPLEIPEPWYTAEKGSYAFYESLSDVIANNENPYGGKTGHGKVDPKTGEILDSQYLPGTPEFDFHNAVAHALQSTILKTDAQDHNTYACPGAIGSTLAGGLVAAAYNYPMIGDTPEETAQHARAVLGDLWEFQKEYPFKLQFPPALDHAVVLAFKSSSNFATDSSPKERHLQILQDTLTFMKALHDQDVLQWDPHCGNSAMKHKSKWRFSVQGGQFVAILEAQAEMEARTIVVSGYDDAIIVFIDPGNRFAEMRHTPSGKDGTYMNRFSRLVGARIKKKHPLTAELGHPATMLVDGKETTVSEAMAIMEGPTELLEEEYKLEEQFFSTNPFGTSNHEYLLEIKPPKAQEKLLEDNQRRCPF